MNASCNWVDWFRSLQFSSVYMLSVNLNTNRHLSLITVSSNPTGGADVRSRGARHRVEGAENAGPENAGPENAGSSRNAASLCS